MGGAREKLGQISGATYCGLWFISPFRAFFLALLKCSATLIKLVYKSGEVFVQVLSFKNARKVLRSHGKGCHRSSSMYVEV